MTDAGDGLPSSRQPTEVLLFADEFGILAQGPRDAAAAAIDRLLDGTSPGQGARLPVTASDGVAAVASAGAVLATSGEYLRLTADAAAKVKEYGEQLDADGALRGWVKDGNKFAGQLTFDKVSLAPEQAMALQSAAVSLALRSAIANVEAAVERVEGKVDEINRRLDSRLRGDVIGTYRHLQQVVSATNSRGRLLQADWDGVASIRNQLFRDLETLRTYVTQAADRLAEGQRLPKREDAIRDFLTRRGDVGDMLELILITEQSLHLWEYLRVQQVAAQEPDHLASAVDDARASLRDNQRLDALLVEALRAAVDQARTVAPLEYRHLFTKGALVREAAAFDEKVREFALNTRLPDLDPLAEFSLPSFGDAREEAQARAAIAGRTVREVGAGAVKGAGRGAVSRGRKVRETVQSRVRRSDDPPS